MAQGGIYDHLERWFCAIIPPTIYWLVLHFNPALRLTRCLCVCMHEPAARRAGQTMLALRYQRVIDETVGWLGRQMRRQRLVVLRGAPTPTAKASRQVLRLGLPKSGAACRTRKKHRFVPLLRQ